MTDPVDWPLTCPIAWCRRADDPMDKDTFRRHVDREHFPDEGHYSWDDLSERNESVENRSVKPLTPIDI